LLRRLQRIAVLGREPQFIAAPPRLPIRKLARRLLESDVEVLDCQRAPSAEKNLVFYNPPVVNRALGIRRSYINESRGGAGILIAICTMVFAESRLHTEVLLTYLRRPIRNFRENGNIRGYRGGYLPNERREIERGLRDGKFAESFHQRARVGIDVGSLDTVVMAGYAGTIAPRGSAPTRRTPRGSSCAVLVGVLRASRSFIVRHPIFFGNTPEHAFIQPVISKSS